jgi:hypothetical protein
LRNRGKATITSVPRASRAPSGGASGDTARHMRDTTPRVDLGRRIQNL